MIKRPYLLFSILIAGFGLYNCKTNTDQSVTTGDSTLTDTTAVVQSVPVSQTPPPHQALNIAVDLTDNPSAITIFRSIFFEDSVVQLTEDITDADVRITAWEYIEEGEFFSSSGKCETFKILQLTRVDGAGTYLDWYTVMPDETTSLVPLSVDITERQSEHSVSLSLDSELSENCSVVIVTESESGGDIDLHESETVTFYSVDKQGFNEIISIQLVDKLIRDYYAEGTEPTGETNTTQSYTVLGSVTNGLHDLQIITTDLIDQSEAANADGETCKWNGSSYDCNLMMVD